MGNSAAKKIGTDFTNGPIMPMLLKFFLPFLAANVLNSLYNTVDTIIIGQFVGGAGIVSVNMGGKMLNMATHFGLAFAGGGQILLAQQVGSGKRDSVNSTIGTLFTEIFALSIICAGIIIAIANPVLTLLNTPAESFGGARSYLLITACGLPFMFGYNAVSSIMSGLGDSKRPLVFIAIAAVVNLIGDIIFIVVFHMDAAGTALATVIGQAVSLVCSLTYLYKKREEFGFDFKLKSFKIDWIKLKIMAKIGFPNALRGLCITVTQLYLLGNVNLYGLNESAAYSIADKVYHLSNVFVNSVSQGSGSMVAQNVGAEKYNRVKRVVLDTFIVSVTGAVVLSVLALTIPKTIFGLFTSEAGVLALAPKFMSVCVIIYFLASLMVTFGCITNGTGKSLLNFAGGILDGVIFRVAFSLLFTKVFGLGVIGLFMGEALARMGPILVDSIYFMSGRWKKTGKLIKE